ncbi:MAG: hypothetical protein AAFU57_12250 [Bacteroidota bacterium]
MKKHFSLGLLLTFFTVCQFYGQDPLTNYTWTSVDENSYRSVITDTDPFGNQSSILECTPNGSWQGFGFQNITIDPNKTYRFSYWTKVLSDTPSYSFTGKISSSSGMISSSGSTINDYYIHSVWAVPGSGTWYLYVGFVKGNGDTSTYDGSIHDSNGLVSGLTTDGHRFATSTTSIGFGASHNSGNTSNRVYYFDPRIEEVTTAGDDSVTDLLNPSGGGNNGGNSGGGTGGYWAQTGSDIHYDGGNVGIGTTTPEAFLEVEGTGTIGGQWNPNNSFFSIKEDGTSSAIIMDSNEIYGSGTLHIGAQTGDIVKFRKVTATGSTDHMIIDANGNMGIGTTTPGSWKLAVNGNIRAKEIKVETGWADYVFKEGYDLPTLEEVEKHIQEKGHLMNIPSEAEVLENGIQLGEMNKLLLEKIEELTLYILEHKKQMADQQKQIDELKKLLENE